MGRKRVKISYAKHSKFTWFSNDCFECRIFLDRFGFRGFNIMSGISLAKYTHTHI